MLPCGESLAPGDLRAVTGDICLPHLSASVAFSPENGKEAKSLGDMLKAVIRRRGNQSWAGRQKKSHAESLQM